MVWILCFGVSESDGSNSSFCWTLSNSRLEPLSFLSFQASRAFVTSWRGKVRQVMLCFLIFSSTNLVYILNALTVDEDQMKAISRNVDRRKPICSRNWSGGLGASCYGHQPCGELHNSLGQASASWLETDGSRYSANPPVVRASSSKPCRTNLLNVGQGR